MIIMRYVVCISKELSFCRSEVMRYKPPCFGMLLLLLLVVVEMVVC